MNFTPHPAKPKKIIWNPEYTPEQIEAYVENARLNDFDLPGYNDVAGHYSRSSNGKTAIWISYTLTDKQKSILTACPDKYKYNPQTGHITGPSGKTLKGFLNSHGYLSISISAKNIGATSIVVHRLAFALQKIDIDYLTVHHDNEIKTDNRLKNLIPMTEREHFKIHHAREAILRTYG